MNRWLGVGKVLHTPQLTHAKTTEPKLRLSITTSTLYEDGREELEYHNVVLTGDFALHWYDRVGKGDTVSIVAKVHYYTSERGDTKKRITEMDVREFGIVSKADMQLNPGKPNDDDIPF